MIRGTTPTHIFKMPIDSSTIEEIKITYAQHDEVIFAKEKSACEIKDGEIAVTLTQEETLLLDCKAMVQIQLRILLTDGSAAASKIIYRPVGKCLDNEVIA